MNNDGAEQLRILSPTISMANSVCIKGTLSCAMMPFVAETVREKAPDFSVPCSFTFGASMIWRRKMKFLDKFSALEGIWNFYLLRLETVITAKETL